nr:NACHT domain-containing protein [Streptomyces avicenniae]
MKRLFRTDEAGAGLVDKPMRIGSLVSFQGQKRTLTERDFRSISKELVERTSHAIGPHEKLPDYELRAVENALTYSLRALGSLDMDDAQAVNLGHRAFAQRLHARTPSTTVGLSRDAVVFYERVLDTASLHILNFFTRRSTFVARTLVEQSRQIHELLTKIDEVISRTSSPGDDSFETRYGSYVARTYNELSIFGLNLTDAPERWPMDAAYLSLDAAPSSTNEDPAFLPAEQVLARRSRVLLRGVAGSGKTTLVQWLAVTSARNEFDQNLLHLHGLIPFVLPLRTLTRGGANLPGPDQFLASVGCPIASAQPIGWPDRVLTSRRGLVLVDGIDEVPENERGPVRQWLRRLLHAYPGNRWLITSRPSAVRHDWLGTEDFTEFDLAPMSRENVASFVFRWHSAAGVGDSYARSLLQVLWTKQDLGRLAINPLMCGLICALHRDRRGYLPDGRKELYDAALSMLLSRRDRERGIHQLGDFRMSEAPQVQLIQRIAYWMIRNGRSEIDRSDAMDLLCRALPTMPTIAEQGSPQEIYRYLIIRSGLLREPSNETVDFIHRTFQDYLAAKAAVESLDFDYMVKNAHLDQWEDVVRMAVAHARPDERSRLLTSLIWRGDSSKTDRERLHLLAAACLEHATELDPGVRHEVQKRAAQLIPPKTISQARALAEVGPVVLELLPGPEGLTDSDRFHIVLTATTIATDAAIPVLAKYRSLTDSAIRTRLIRSWARFDSERYMEEVLSHVDEHGMYFPVTSRQELALLAPHGGRSHIEIAGPMSPEDFRSTCNPNRLTHLKISTEMNCTWEWLANFHKLRTLVFSFPGTIDLTSFPKTMPLADVLVITSGNVIGSEQVLSRTRHIRQLDDGS